MPLSIDTPAFTRTVLTPAFLQEAALGRMNFSLAWNLVLDVLRSYNKSVTFTVIGKRTTHSLLLRPDQTLVSADTLVVGTGLFAHFKLQGDSVWSTSLTGLTSTPREGKVVTYRCTRSRATLPAPPSGEELSGLVRLRAAYLANRTIIP